MTTALGEFGPPPDAVAWGALLTAILAWAVLGRRTTERFRPSDRTLVIVASLTAGALSLGYVAFYLRGGPRIVDATSYFLQGRALSEGHVAMPVPTPSGNFRGRFLLADAAGATVSGIFPPGYPAALGLGFLLGAPMLVGPVVAAALVWATFAVAKRLFGDAEIARLAALLSVVSAVRRYHTADTMSHGWAALLFTGSLALVLGEGAPRAVFSGFLAGWLVATRPVSGAVLVLLVLYAARSSPRRAVLLVLGTLPPIALFAVEQRVATGHWLTSTQLAYYAVADGPSGCFRYGFGADVGCLFEHGDFVRARLANGFGVWEAAGTTLRRLKMHLADAGNLELFAPVLAYGMRIAWREQRSRPAVLGAAGMVLAYVPFYFDGNFPGGGARLYADVLPLEHALIAAAVFRLGALRAALPAALVGFALHTSYDHRALAEREGGRPMFEPRVLDAAGVRRGLLFVDTDHGFALAWDPAVASPHRGIVVARRRGDAHDALLWDRLGRPPAFDYEFSPSLSIATPRVVVRELRLPSVLRFEAEAEWPPLAVSDGFALPDFPACASARRALALFVPGEDPVRVRLELSVPRGGRYAVRTGWVIPARGFVEAGLTVGAATTHVSARGRPGECAVVEGPSTEFRGRSEKLDIITKTGGSIDFVELWPELPAPPP